MSTAVYRLFDADDGCMYVGCSDTPHARIGFHARRHDLPTEIARVELTYHNSKVEALEVEQEEIRRLEPAMNVMCLLPIQRAAPGHLHDAILNALATAGPMSSLEIATRIGVLPANVASKLATFRRQGIVRIKPGTTRARVHELVA